MDDFKLEENYNKELGKSKELYEKAVKVFPSGVTHDGRYFMPFPLYVEKAQGAKKWDVDGNEYIDYWVGHGSLMLGHNHPQVLAAVQEQLIKGTHYGACHELEIKWGEKIKALVPSVEKVRFTSSGTEATHMAMRLARAYTGKNKIIKFEGHFHGWHDYVNAGVMPPYEVPVATGIPQTVLQTIILAPPNNIDYLRNILDQDSDVAGIIVEPSGGSYGIMTLETGFMGEVQKLAKEKGILFIMDEVITGFRYAPGGCQEYFNLNPDLSTFAKILAGGLPGGAVGGKKEIMELLEFKPGDSDWNRYKKIAHPGTYNANPLSAAAGYTTLSLLEDGTASSYVNKLGRQLREELNRIIEKKGIEGCVRGEASIFHIYLSNNCDYQKGCSKEECKQSYLELIKQKTGAYIPKFRKLMLLNGIDLFGASGMLSTAHGEEELGKTIRAFEKALNNL